MRIVTGLSGIVVSFTLIIMIHAAIVNKHVRDVEMNNGLVSATDFATDHMQELCEDLDFSKSDKEEATNQVIQEFCKALQSVLVSDGEVRVYVAQADMESGSFDFIVEETYEYGFQGRKGVARCERAVCFYQ